MSDSESVDYLQPGFDPAGLTNPRLRSILVTYNVHYPSNAKKPELVELFNTHVAPQASKILSRRARAKRSSMGIVDAQPSTSYSQSTTAFGDSFDQETPQQLSPKKRRAGRPSSRATPHIDEQEEEEAEDTQRRQRRSSPRKRSSRQSSFQPPESVASYSVAGASDTDTGNESRTAVAAGRPPSRRARTKTPQVKLEPTEEERFMATPVAAPRYGRPSSGDEGNDTVFTYDNPFQSGSSPLSGSSPAQRRRTANYDEPVSHKRTSAGASARVPSSTKKSRVVSSPAVQASYDSPPIRSAVSQRHMSPFAKAVSRSPKPEEESEEEEEEEEEQYEEEYDPLEPGEEFTPEEQLELTQEEAVQRRHNAVSSRRSGKTSKSTRRRKSVASALATPLLVLVLTLLGVYGAWYRQEKRAVGFCGLGRLAVPLLSEQIEKLEWLPDWVRDIEIPNSLQVFIEPTCEPCPSHAFCYSDFTVRCENGYIEKAHPLSLGGLVPLPPTCEPDGERARRVKAVADKAIEELRDRRAKWECGDLVDEDGQVPEDPAIDVPVLKEVISEKRSKKMSKEEFDDLWTAAIGDIESRDEVESEPDSSYAATDPGTVPNTRLSSTSLARLPLSCAVRRSIRLGLARHRFPLSVLVLTFLGFVYLRYRFRSRRADRARVPALVDLVLERLAAQKELWLYEDDFEGGAGSGQGDDADDSSFLPDPFLFLPQLRDDVLRTTHSLAARERIWKHVRAVVEQNSNVRTGQREGRNGEVGRAWEWIGPVGTAASVIAGGDAGERGGRASINALELSARRRRSGRASLMPTGSGANSRAGSAAPRDSIGASSGRAGDVSDASASDAQQPQLQQTEGAGEHRSALHKRWQESRPIY